jgi:osmoprotectant transport system ATP-binding protein
MINRLIEPSAGDILINNRNILKLNAVALRRDIGYVIQQVGLFPHMTIDENVTIVPTLLGWPEDRKRERACELLSLVGLTPSVHAGRFPNELSGGQQQRVGVARALAADPPILLMDEPFGALDPITRRDIQEEFLNLKRQIRKTIVFVTHDIIEAVTLGDRLGVISEGRLTQLGTPQDVVNSPANEVVEKIIGRQRFQLTLSSETVEEVIDALHPTVSTEILRMPVQHVRDLMRRQETDILPVIDEGRHLLSAVTQEALAGMQDDISVEKAVPSPPFSIAHDTTVLTALNMMIEENIGVASVTDREGIFRGIVSRRRLLQKVNAIFDRGSPGAADN